MVFLRKEFVLFGVFLYKSAKKWYPCEPVKENDFINLEAVIRFIFSVVI